MRLGLLYCAVLLVMTPSFATTNRMYYPSDQPPFTVFTDKPVDVKPNISIIVLGVHKEENQQSIVAGLESALGRQSSGDANVVILGTEASNVKDSNGIEQNIIGNPYCNNLGPDLELYNGYFYAGIPRATSSSPGLKDIWSISATKDTNHNLYQALYEASKVLRSMPIMLTEEYTSCSELNGSPGRFERDGFVTRAITSIGDANPRNICSVGKHIVIVDVDPVSITQASTLKSISPKDYKAYFNVDDPEKSFLTKIKQKEGYVDYPTLVARINADGLYSNMTLEINDASSFEDRLINLAKSNDISINALVNDRKKHSNLVQATNGVSYSILDDITPDRMQSGIQNIINYAQFRQKEANNPIVSQYLVENWFSNTYSVMDRPMVDVFEQEPDINDLSSFGAIRYHTVYDFYERKGDIHAVAPYLDGEEVKNKTIWKLSDVKSNLNATVRYLHASFNGYSNQDIMTIGTSGSVLGSMTYSNIALASKDVLYTNLNDYGGKYKNELVRYLKEKIKEQPNNYMIVADDNGSIFIINAIRGTKSEDIGKVVAVIRSGNMDEENVALLEPTVRMGGKTKVADGFGYPNSSILKAVTLGVTGMGSGGKTLVGYQIEGNLSYQRGMNINFIISNELDMRWTDHYPTEARVYKDLGYTYSDFEVYSEATRMVALFGNGYGVERSVLYAMNMRSGNKIREIVLNEKGYGASSPTLITKPGADGLPEIDRIYVGDYAGNLYRVTFKDGNISQPATVTTIYTTDDLGVGENVISVKPLVIPSTDDYGNPNGYTVYVATGVLGVNQEATATQRILKINDVAPQSNRRNGKIAYADKGALDYYVDKSYPLNLDLPTYSMAEGGLGYSEYSILLNEDGVHSNEQVVFDPVLESNNQVVLMSTWGGKKDFGGDSSRNICFNSDLPYGKRVALPIKVRDKLFNLDGLSDVADTMTVFGQINGDFISANNDPYYSLVKESLAFQKSIIDLMGQENSSYYYDKKIPYGAYCAGDIYGRVLCSRSFRKMKNLTPKRVNIHRKY